MMNQQSLHVIGLMSGTSMDGMDMAFVKFTKEHAYRFELIAAQTIPYTKAWKEKLSRAMYMNQNELAQLDASYGKWIANAVAHFIQELPVKPDLIASHGHTVFHKPTEKITLQIGSGKIIRDIAGIPVVNNFRAQDVMMGGQGAPLVPIGDELLFPGYDFYLNLGGFANVSWKENGKRRACDIGPCNILLNEICKRIHIEFDKNGQLAKQGNVIHKLLSTWNAIEYYKQQAPKSLGREWLTLHFLSDIENKKYSETDLLATATYHIVEQIKSFLRNQKPVKISDEDNSKIFVTGGGAHNKYLLEILNLQNDAFRWIVPDSSIVDFKEAIVFALLGYLRWFDEINILSSVTGAARDHSGGDVFK